MKKYVHDFFFRRNFYNWLSSFRSRTITDLCDTFNITWGQSPDVLNWKIRFQNSLHYGCLVPLFTFCVGFLSDRTWFSCVYIDYTGSNVLCDSNYFELHIDWELIIPWYSHLFWCILGIGLDTIVCVGLSLFSCTVNQYLNFKSIYHWLIYWHSFNNNSGNFNLHTYILIFSSDRDFRNGTFNNNRSTHTNLPRPSHRTELHNMVVLCR